MISNKIVPIDGNRVSACDNRVDSMTNKRAVYHVVYKENGDGKVADFKQCMQ